MRERIFTDDRNGERRWFSVSAKPDVCPICHNNVEPVQLLGILEGSEYEGAIETVYRCPRAKCHSMFFARFTRSRSPENYPDCFMYRGVYPWAPEEKKWAEGIESLSPRFAEVYSSAIAAGAHGLTDLVGMGLRKAVEFLIKDYAISAHPDEEATIRKMFLGPVIEKYCDSTKLKATASRAVWIGNDESHYERIWTDKDVEDLKVLIRLAAGWVESEILTAKYTVEMPAKKKPSA